MQSPAAAAAMWIYKWDTRAVFSLSLSCSRILSTRNVSALKTVCCFKTVVETILAVLILILFLEGSVFKTVKKIWASHIFVPANTLLWGPALCYWLLCVLDSSGPVERSSSRGFKTKTCQKIVMRCTNVSYLSWMWSVDSALLIKANCDESDCGSHTKNVPCHVYRQPRGDNLSILENNKVNGCQPNWWTGYAISLAGSTLFKLGNSASH